MNIIHESQYLIKMNKKVILSKAHLDGTWQVLRISSIPPQMEQPFPIPPISLFTLYIPLMRTS